MMHVYMRQEQSILMVKRPCDSQGRLIRETLLLVVGYWALSCHQTTE
jgi:hypothetical protein